jgi:hypothetical protein
MPPFWAPPLALIFSTFGTDLGIYAFRSRRSLPRANMAWTPTNTDLDFIYILSGRDIAIGLMMYAFYFQCHFKAMGTVLSRIMFPGVVDAVVSELSEWGTSGEVLTHAVGRVGFGILGWGMMSWGL